MAGYTKQERTLILIARIWAVLFLATAILFAAAPDYTLKYITDIGRGLFGWYSPAMALGQQLFWLVPSVSLLVALSYLCMIVQKDPAQHIEYIRLLLLVTFISAIGFLICLFVHERQFSYLVGACVNCLIFFITLVVYKKATTSRNRWS